ncbi:imelysin family protein [Xanthocytophaga flava]|uniref:imelysin family protein n=1 Tax=Xanthocytophaga flava TaxID=3048013 RepID=UPI0028D8AF5F|nr:imelysin family protein [Xanthocytophaga flavus]MDJ1471924.1 imelysin family protein [Xanthocytophaga flavus]
MKIHKILLNLIVVFVGATGFIACDSEKSSSDSFDRKTMLQVYADSLIVPAFTDLQTKTNALQTAATTFVTTPTTDNLTTLQQAWETAFIAWQYANAYNIGPADEEGTRRKLSEEIGIFPVNTSSIESKISAGNTSMTDVTRDTRGFLTVEYLIFNLQNDNASIVTQYQNSTSRGNYLQAVITNLKSQIDGVVTAWAGNYKTTFVTNDGIKVGSSMSALYNNFVQSYETIKNGKVGLPLGKMVDKAYPEKVEAYYSGKSLEMIKHHLKAMENIWKGRTKNGTDIIGFKEYLASVDGGNALNTTIESQLTAINNALTAVPTNATLASQIKTNPAPIDTLYTELQKNVAHIKSEMAVLLGISITFTSGDGD